MSLSLYQKRICGVLEKIWKTQMGNIEKASAAMADNLSLCFLLVEAAQASLAALVFLFPRGASVQTT